MKPELSEASHHYQGLGKATGKRTPAVRREGRVFAFGALTIRDYRRYASANLISSVSLWTVRTAQDWIVLQLSGSTAAVGITVTLQFLPTLLFGPIGGLLVDRYDKKKLLLTTQSTSIAVGAALAWLTLGGHIQVWHIYVAAAVTGFSAVVDNPSRMVYFSELVGKEHLKNAVSINSMIFQLGAMIGPALGGVLLKFGGGGWVFTCSIIAGMYAIFVFWSVEIPVKKNERTRDYRKQFLNGWCYFWGKSVIRHTAIMLFCTALFAFAMPVVMAAFARHVFNLEAGGFGLLNSCVALGSLCGALLSTQRRNLRLRTVIFGAIRLGLVMIAASLVPLNLPELPFEIFGERWSISLVIFGLMMVCVGFFSLLFLTSANQLVQTSTSQSIRGRVMSFYVMFLLGGQSLGGPLIGQLAEILPPAYVLFIAGAVPVVVGLILAVYLKKIGCLKFKGVNIGRRFTISVD